MIENCIEEGVWLEEPEIFWRDFAFRDDKTTVKYSYRLEEIFSEPVKKAPSPRYLAGLSGHFHAKCVIRRKLEYAAVVLKAKIVAFFKRIRIETAAQGTPLSKRHNQAKPVM
jgi:hypothetical protein